MDPSFTWEPFGRVQREAGDAATAAMPRQPARRLIVLTCMDARLEPLRILGLRLGDAHVVRNAGAEANADAVRSIRMSHTAMGTRRAIVIGHTDCGAHTSDDAAEDGVRAAMRTLRSALPELVVEGAVYDVRAGGLRALQ